MPATQRMPGDYLVQFGEQLKVVCRDIAHVDLRDRNLYLIWSLYLADESGCIHGLQYRSLDLVAQEYLTSIGAWEGRGPAILLNDESLAKVVSRSTPPAWDDEQRRNRFEDLCTAIALHELAHVADDGFSRGPVPPPRIVAQHKECVMNCISAEASAEDLDDAARKCEWICHSDRWVRASLHIHHRAVKYGHWPRVFFTPHAMANNAQYGLSDILAYDGAIGDEPSRRIDDSLTDILASEPPAAFTELFKSDEARRSALITSQISANVAA